MKLNSLIIILLLTNVVYSFGQSNRIKLALEAGVNYSSSTEKTEPLDKENMFLPQVGFIVNYTLSDKFLLQSGLVYNMKGQKAEGNGDKQGIQVDGSVKLTQHVLQVPILASLKFISGNNINCFFSTGPYFAYGIGGKTDAKGYVNGTPFEKESDTFGDAKILKHFDSGLKFKISTEITHFSVSLSYEMGIMDIGNKNIMGGDVDYKNRVSSLTIGYIF